MHRFDDHIYIIIWSSVIWIKKQYILIHGISKNMLLRDD